MMMVTIQYTLKIQWGKSNWRGPVCLLGYDRIEKSDEGGGELCVASCWRHYGTRLGHGPQITIWLGWSCSQHIKGGSTFDKVGNPGGRSSFSYHPVFASVSQGDQYKACCILAGCQPIPPNEDNAAICTHGGWIFLTRSEEEGRWGCDKGERCWRGYSSMGLMCKRRYFLEAGKDAWTRIYQISLGWHNALSDRGTFYLLSYSVAAVWNIPFRNPGGKIDSVLFWGKEMVKSLRL